MQRLQWVSLLCLGLMMTACQPYWQADADFGTSVNKAIRAQAVNPDPPKGDPYAKAHMDGVAAKKSVDNYQKSFDKPKAESGSIITINNGTSSSTAGSPNH